MKYFVAVAQSENIQRASEKIRVSPASLSKAISRLEDELQVPLFFKTGRNIRLTPQGIQLRQRATQILLLEEDARLKFRGPTSDGVNIHISSEEILQASFGTALAQKARQLYPNAKLNFMIRTDVGAIEQVQDGEAQLAIIATEPPQDLVSKVLAEIEFKTCVGKSHPLAKEGKARRQIPVEEVLQYQFVIPGFELSGKVTKSSSPDGWRDDKFPRRIGYTASGLKMMESLIEDGLAIGYLPNYFLDSTDFVTLKVSGCPYVCKQTIRMVTRDPKALSWLNRLWDLI